MVPRRACTMTSTNSGSTANGVWRTAVRSRCARPARPHRQAGRALACGSPSGGLARARARAPASLIGNLVMALLHRWHDSCCCVCVASAPCLASLGPAACVVGLCERSRLVGASGFELGDPRRGRGAWAVVRYVICVQGARSEGGGGRASRGPDSDGRGYFYSNNNSISASQVLHCGATPPIRAGRMAKAEMQVFVTTWLQTNAVCCCLPQRHALILSNPSPSMRPARYTTFSTRAPLPAPSCRGSDTPGRRTSSPARPAAQTHSPLLLSVWRR